MRKIGRKLGTVMLTLAVLALSCGSAMAGWTITDLGAALSSTGSGITGAAFSSINNNGQIVGQANFANTVGYHAALWQNGTVYDLGILGSGPNTSSARYISDSGIIVGEAYSDTTSTTNMYRQAVIFSLGSSPQNIHSTMTYNANNSVAVGVGNGYILGQSYNDIITVQHATLWGNGTSDWTSVSDKNPTGYVSSASALKAINSSGQMVGYSKPWDIGYARPTLWNTDSSVTYLDISTDPKYSGQIWAGIPGYAQDINDSGQIPVWFGNGISGIWQNGTFTEVANHFGFFGIDLQAINNSGVAVGSVYTSSGANQGYHGVMYDSRTDTLIDLGALLEGTGWYITDAVDINDKGQILVGANRIGFNNPLDNPTTLVLTPAAAPVPIPAAAPLFASGLAALGVFRRRFFCV